jgi:pantoate--beta-alanine ligase
LDKYPRNLERDVTLAEATKVDIVFAPEPADMYGDRHETAVHLSKLPNRLCGLSRPGHFSGVATVVAKLFNIVKPNIAIFGEKDYQQLAIIRQMVEDLNFDIQILSVPIVREPDGLAMSSRNVYLSEQERASALSLNRALREAQEMVNVGIRDGATIVDRTRDHIHSQPHTKIDYVTLCDPRSLENVEWVNQTAVLALAVWVGQTRLIDNAVLSPPDR